MMFRGSAVELPFDASVIDELSRVSDSSGFISALPFHDACKNNPITTLIKWMIFIGYVSGVAIGTFDLITEAGDSLTTESGISFQTE